MNPWHICRCQIWTELHLVRKKFLLLFNHSVMSESSWPAEHHFTRIVSCLLVASGKYLVFVSFYNMIFFKSSCFHTCFPKLLSFIISCSSELSCYTSSDTELFVLLGVKGKSTVVFNIRLQKQVFLHCAFLMLQLSQPYVEVYST